MDQGYCWNNWPKYTAKIADHKLHGLNESALDITLSHYTNSLHNCYRKREDAKKNVKRKKKEEEWQKKV